MDNELFQKIVNKYPFLSICRYADHEYVGIILNQDNAVTTMYDFGGIVEAELKQTFLELGEIWWWESNRMIPINIFLKGEWDIFRPYLRTFNNKNLEILSGQITSLSNLSKNRKKRKSITLVRKVD
jgi:hypothetical protein